MYKVLIAVSDEKMITEIKALHVWGGSSGFEYFLTENKKDKLFSDLKEERYDLLIVEMSANDETLFTALKRIKAEGLCRRIALCGSVGDLQTARKGMLIGAYEYFISPLEPNDMIRLFSRIKKEENGNAASEIYIADELLELFENRNSSIGEYLRTITDIGIAKNAVKSVVSDIFSQNEWLDLYVREDQYLGSDDNNDDLIKKFLSFFEIYCKLYPPHNEKIHSVIDYVLFNPENDLRQKTLSEKLYINSSYLSTMFTAQTDTRFVDYITIVKLHRAAWLLRNTGMKIVEIAERLDYKDIGYFSKQFKKLFGITPSGYRVPENYDFTI